MKTVTLRYHKGEGKLQGSLVGIQFKDKEDSLILTAGWWGDNSLYADQVVVMDDDERIVGFQSGRRGGNFAKHYDF